MNELNILIKRKKNYYKKSCSDNKHKKNFCIVNVYHKQPGAEMTTQSRLQKEYSKKKKKNNFL